MLVSVIVPVYNKEQYLHSCIDSILSQTYTEIEIILVNDGSTDNSGKICDEYKEKDERVKVYHNANGGLSKARNYGIDKSNGEYVTFVDADDFIEPEFIEILASLRKKYNADIVQCNRRYNNEERGKESEIEEIYSNIEAQNLLYGKDYIPTVNSTCKLINKKIFNKVKFEEGKIHEDEIIAHKMLYLANKLVFINKRMYVVNRSQNSITRSEFSLKKLDYLYALEDRIQFYESIGISSLVDLTIYRYVIMLKGYIEKIKENFSEEKILIRQLKKKLIVNILRALAAQNLTLKNKCSLIFKVVC